VAYIDRQQGSLLLAAFICTRQHSEAENSLKLIQVTNILTCMHGQQQQVKFKLKYQHKQQKDLFHTNNMHCMMTNVSKHT
jgi:hypothetical protein